MTKCPICKQEMQPIRAYAEGGYRCENGACGIQYVGLTTGDIDKINAVISNSRAAGYAEAREQAISNLTHWSVSDADDPWNGLLDAIRAMQPQEGGQG